MPTILELGEEIRELTEAIEANDGELDAALEAWFEKVHENVQHKVDAYVSLLREHELRAQARKAEADRLAQRAAVDANFAKRLKARLQLFLEQTGQRRVETARYCVTLAKNGGALPVRLTVAAEELPPRFQSRSVSADLDAIRQALLAGESVPGAALGERNFHLRIQ